MGTTWQPTLFGAAPVPAGPKPKESETVRRTKRQLALLETSRHPLSSPMGIAIWLHREAAPADDRDAPGRRCGNCIFRVVDLHHNRSYAKCHLPGLKPGSTPRVSHSEATDLRSWWPGCGSHCYASEGAPSAG